MDFFESIGKDLLEVNTWLKIKGGWPRHNSEKRLWASFSYPRATGLKTGPACSRQKK